MPDDFYDGGKSRSADEARKAKAVARDLAALGMLGKESSQQAAEREDRVAEEYSDRAELLQIEQAVVELRAAEVRDRIARKVTGADLLPGTEADAAKPDEAWSLLTPSTYHGAPITAAEAARTFREQARAGGSAPSPAAAAGGQDGAAAGGGSDDDGFVGLDDWL